MKTKKDLYEILAEKREKILKSEKATRQHVRSIKQGLATREYQDAFIQQAYSYIAKI
jgi:hypothetical protein